MHTDFIVNSRFCGPPDSGNGGYVCGMLAKDMPGAGAVQVTLHAPPPLDTRLRIEVAGDGSRSLQAGDAGVATAQAAALDLQLPEMPEFDRVAAAQPLYAGFKGHIFPCCFVCGPDRDAGDGLRIFAAPLPNSDLVAATWVPDASLADENGLIRSEFLWAALDCPGYFAFRFGDAMPALLGRMTASTRNGLRSGDRCVLAGWEIKREGRKHISGTVLFGADGTVFGQASATWITLKKNCVH